MKCICCGAEIDEGNKFCGTCGSNVHQDNVVVQVPRSNNKKRKKIIIVISSILLFFVILIVTLLLLNKSVTTLTKEKNALFFEDIIILLDDIGNDWSLKISKKNEMYVIPVGGKDTCSNSNKKFNKSSYGSDWNYAYIGIIYTGSGFDYYFIGEDNKNVGVPLISHSEILAERYDNPEKSKIYNSYDNTDITKEISNNLKELYTINENKTFDLNDKQPSWIMSLIPSNQQIEKVIIVSGAAGCIIKNEDNNDNSNKKSNINDDISEIMKHNYEPVSQDNNVTYYKKDNKILKISESIIVDELQKSLTLYVYDVDDNYSVDEDLEFINLLVRPDISNTLNLLKPKIIKILNTAHKNEYDYWNEDYETYFNDLTFVFDYKQDYEGDRKVLYYYIADSVDNMRITEKVVIDDFDTYYDDTAMIFNKLYNKDISKYKDIIKREFINKNTADFRFKYISSDENITIRINPRFSILDEDPKNRENENEYVFEIYVDKYSFVDFRYFLSHKYTTDVKLIKEYLESDFKNLKNLCGVDFSSTLDSLVENIMDYYKNKADFKENSVNLIEKYVYMFPEKDSKTFDVLIEKNY